MSNKTLIDAAVYAHEQWHKSGDVFGAMQQLGFEASKAKKLIEYSDGKNNDWLTLLDGLPPEGTECEVLNLGIDNAEWEKCKILYMGKFVCVYESDSCKERVGHHNLYNIQFRPIKSDREKAIEAAMSVALSQAYFGETLNICERFAAGLYETGLLRLPENKND